MFPTCVVCSKSKKDANRYYKHTTCKACYMRIWRKQNPKANRAIEARRYSPNRTAAWRKKNPERWKVLTKRNYEKTKPSFIARNMARKAAKWQRTPKWLTKEQHNEINKMYKLRPEGYHVDHIIPLRGENVSGLHVPWNLQHLPAAENNKKNNRITPEWVGCWEDLPWQDR